MYNYVHIPFCRQKCLYCKFALTPRWQDARIRHYLGFLKEEIRGFYASPQPSPCMERGFVISSEVEKSLCLSEWNNGSMKQTCVPFLDTSSALADSEWCFDDRIQSIYFGWGTPSVLSVAQIHDIIDTFREQRPFAPDIEITLEANPEDISSDFVCGIMSAGVNRLSLGIQTLRVESLRMVGRAEEIFAFWALDTLQACGFSNVSIDFILGLPKVQSGEALSDIRALLDAYSCIQHVSVYMLEDEKYPAGWQEVSLPPAEFESEFLAIRSYLLERWFVHYELSNFARPGYESRHNRAYWNHANYRGFGLSAASYLDGKRWTNATSFDGYYRGETVDDETLTADQISLEEAMFRLRTFRGLPESYIERKNALEDFIASGYLRRENGEIFLNSTWIFLIDHIMGELL